VLRDLLFQKRIAERLRLIDPLIESFLGLSLFVVFVCRFPVVSRRLFRHCMTAGEKLKKTGLHNVIRSSHHVRWSDDGIKDRVFGMLGMGGTVGGDVGRRAVCGGGA